MREITLDLRQFFGILVAEFDVREGVLLILSAWGTSFCAFDHLGCYE